MIKHKMCKCGCGKPPTLSYQGYRFSCAPDEVKEKVGTKREVAQKRKYARNKVRNLLPSKEQDNLQQLWFSMVSEEIRKNPYCWETGEFISEKYYRSASAHILSKSTFPSVSTHPLNFLILSPSNGSHQKTDRLDTFSKMKVWPIAVERFKQIEPYIKERHKILNEFRGLIYDNEIVPIVNAVSGKSVTINLRRSDNQFVNSEITIASTGQRADVFKAEIDESKGEMILTLKPQKTEDAEFEIVKPKQIENI